MICRLEVRAPTELAFNGTLRYR